MLKLNSKIKYLLFIIATVFLFNVKAYAITNFNIDSYHLDMKVNLNNSFDIKEKITVTFTQNSHGILRNIPKRNTLLRENGKIDYNNARISNIKVNNKYIRMDNNKDFVLRIGNPNKIISKNEQVTYIIEYNYALGKDRLKTIDELYFNILGNSWDTIINNYSFNIQMPKKFDEKKLGFSVGAHGSSGHTNNLIYEVKENTINGKFNATLFNDSITIRLELEDGYFTKGIDLDKFISIPIIIFVISILLGINIWKTYGKDDYVTEIVTFYPPDNLTPLEIAYLYKEHINIKDISSLFIYLASKNYLKIEQTDKKKVFKITKTNKDISELPKALQTFMNALDDSSYTDNLPEKLGKNAERIIEQSISNKKKLLYDQTQDIKYNKIFKLLGITILLGFVPLLLYSANINIKLIISLILIFEVITFLILKIKKIQIDLNFENILITTILIGFFISIFISLFIKDFEIIIQDAIYLISAEKLFQVLLIGSVISSVILIIIAIFLPKLSEYGINIKGRIKGFKRFLKTAEKERIEMLIDENKEYFYDILPYAAVLGVTKKFITHFEKITIPSPSWYIGNNYNIYTMNHIINSTATATTSSYSSYQASTSSGSSFSGGGGFSGGGFSGGGSGGGGGGSW